MSRFLCSKDFYVGFETHLQQRVHAICRLYQSTQFGLSTLYTTQR